MKTAKLRRALVGRLPPSVKRRLRPVRDAIRRARATRRPMRRSGVTRDHAASARQARSEGDLRAASTHLRQALMLDPANLGLARESAETALELHDWRSLLESTEHLRRVAGTRIRVRDLRHQAIAYRKLGRFREAQATLDAALTRGPDSVLTWIESMRLHRATENWEQLLAVATQIRALEPGPPDTVVYQHEAVAHRHLGDYAASRRTIAEGLRRHADDESLIAEAVATAASQGCWYEACLLSSQLPPERKSSGRESRRRLRWLEHIRDFGGAVVWDDATTTARFHTAEQLLGTHWSDQLQQDLLSAALQIAELGGVHADEARHIAEILNTADRPDLAVELLDTWLSSDCSSHSYQDLRARHDLEFDLARLRNELDIADTQDPLLRFTVVPPTQQVVVDGEPAAVVRCDLRSQALTTTVQVLREDIDAVAITVDDTVVRTIGLEGPGLRTARYDFHRSVLEDWSGTVRLVASVVAQGRPTASAEIDVDTGTQRSAAPIAAMSLNKKGSARSIRGLDDSELSALLDWYSELRWFFRDHLDRELFVTYGTLLGIVRDGKLLDHDDDIDLAFLSHGESPREVRDDTALVVQRIAEAGLDVHVGRTLRPVPREGALDAGIPVDIQTCWLGDGLFWGYGRPIELERPDFEPFAEAEFHGVVLAVPRRPEAFLRQHYGPTWLYPDSGFRYDPRATTAAQRARADSALLTMPEVRRIERELTLRRTLITASTGHDPGYGRVTSYFGQPLYPLESFVRYG